PGPAQPDRSGGDRRPAARAGTVQLSGCARGDGAHPHGSPAERAAGAFGLLRGVGRGADRRRRADHPRGETAPRGRHEPDPGPLADQHRHRDDQRHLRLQRYRGVDASNHGRARRRLGRGLRRLVRRQAMFRKTVLIFAVALTLPLSAPADYLYGLNKDSGIEPYVFFLADVSGSMKTQDAGCPAGCTLRTGSRCRCGNKDVDPYTRMEALQATLKELIPQLDNVFLGMAKFGVREGLNSCRIVRTNPLPTKAGQQPPNSDALIAEVNKFKPDGGTPIGAALENALSHLQDVRKADTHSHCRPYAVVILTDGQPDCSSTYGGSEPKDNPSKAYAAVDALRNAKIP